MLLYPLLTEVREASAARARLLLMYTQVPYPMRARTTATEMQTISGRYRITFCSVCVTRSLKGIGLSWPFPGGRRAYFGSPVVSCPPSRD